MKIHKDNPSQQCTMKDWAIHEGVNACVVLVYAQNDNFRGYDTIEF